MLPRKLLQGNWWREFRKTRKNFRSSSCEYFFPYQFAFKQENNPAKWNVVVTLKGDQMQGKKGMIWCIVAWVIVWSQCWKGIYGLKGKYLKVLRAHSVVSNRNWWGRCCNLVFPKFQVLLLLWIRWCRYFHFSEYLAFTSRRLKADRFVTRAYKEHLSGSLYLLR